MFPLLAAFLQDIKSWHKSEERESRTEETHVRVIPVARLEEKNSATVRDRQVNIIPVREEKTLISRHSGVTETRKVNHESHV